MTQSPEQQTPEQHIKALEKELEKARLKSDFFETVVKVMDRDFVVRLSKSTKPSY